MTRHEGFVRPSSDLPGSPTSPWLATTPDAAYPALEGDVTADVCIVGAGITGLSTAVDCLERDRSVVVIERDQVGAGTTGASTATLTSQHGLCYARLTREFGQRAARTYASVNEAAIETVAARIDSLDADCGFERQPAYVYGDEPDRLRREARAGAAAGLEATLVTSVPPFERATAAVKVAGQAAFHPRAYLLSLAESLYGAPGARIHEGTRVLAVDPGTRPRVHTSDGRVTADHVVLATGYPLLERVGLDARLYPQRSYGLALRIGTDGPSGLYHRISDPVRSVRTHRHGGGERLLVGGEHHKTGQGGSTTNRYERLLEWARGRFPVERVVHRWSGQDYVSIDGLPLIGRPGPVDGVSIATGFGGWGLTTGVAAGRLLADSITGSTPPALDLFDPLRLTPKASLSRGLTENADAASQLVTDWARTLVTPDARAIDPGTGRVIRTGRRPVAAARDAAGTLHTVSAVCPHDRGILEWNDAECTWDCPCHGSRFAPDGRLIEGPATADLESVTVPRE